MKYVLQYLDHFVIAVIGGIVASLCNLGGRFILEILNARHRRQLIRQHFFRCKDVQQRFLLSLVEYDKILFERRDAGATAFCRHAINVGAFKIETENDFRIVIVSENARLVYKELLQRKRNENPDYKTNPKLYECVNHSIPPFI